MKRILMVVLFAVALMASVTCYAKITVADLNIGGIYCGQAYSDVIEKLGQPIRIQRAAPAGGSNSVFKCGNGEIIVGCNSVAHVESAAILSGDGVYTAAGIGFGSSYDDVIKAYGQADSDTILKNPKSPILQYLIPKIEPEADGYLEFHLNSDKKVTAVMFYIFYK